MTIFYHMLPAAVWQRQPTDRPYASDTLATEGFTHCTAELEMLPVVANRYYRAIPGDFILLCIDEAKVQPAVKWEAASGHLFPHIYGPLNRDAILKIMPFPRLADGRFTVPQE